MSTRSSCTASQWHLMQTEFCEQFKKSQDQIAKIHKEEMKIKKDKFKTMIKKRSNKVHNLEIL